MAKRKYITVAADPREFAAITTAAKKARMSRSAWMLWAAEQKLAREAKPKGGRAA